MVDVLRLADTHPSQPLPSRPWLPHSSLARAETPAHFSPDDLGTAPAPSVWLLEVCQVQGRGWGSRLEGSLRAPASKGHSVATRQAGMGL